MNVHDREGQVGINDDGPFDFLITRRQINCIIVVRLLVGIIIVAGNQIMNVKVRLAIMPRTLMRMGMTTNRRECLREQDAQYEDHVQHVSHHL